MVTSALSPSPVRLTGLGLVLLFHLVAIYALLTWSGVVHVTLYQDPTVRFIPDADHPARVPPPPQTPTMEVKPLPPMPAPFDPGPSDGTGIHGDLVQPRLDPRFGALDPPYPPASVHLGEEGKVTLALLIGADGRVTEARVERSSGHPRLDEAALQAALHGARFVPGTEDGVVRPMWHRITIAFRLSDLQGK